MIVSLPLDVAVGVRLRDAEDAVDAVGAGPLVRRVVRRQNVLLLLHGVLLLLVLVARRRRRSVRDDRSCLRRDRANWAAIAASATVASMSMSAVSAVSAVTSVSVSVVANRFGFLGRLISHDSDVENVKKEKQ